MTMIDRQAAIDSIHKTIYGFLCGCTDEEETPISKEDELLLEVNKAVCNGIKALPAIEALKKRKTGGWNVITKYPMDAEERATWSENLGYEIPDDEAFMYGNLPEEGVEVLICTMSGTIFIDTLCRDEGCYFEYYGEMDGIVAWRPLPEPYMEVDE